MVFIFFSVLIYIKISIHIAFFKKRNKTIKVIFNRNNEDKEKVLLGKPESGCSMVNMC